MKTELPADSRIPGVFAYLDAILSPDCIAEAETIGTEPRKFCHRPCVRCRVREEINETFRLQWRECPLNKELAGFRLYHRDDMADALAVAYGMFLRGENPIEALQADYAVSDYGLLGWADIDDLRDEARRKRHHLDHVWIELGRFVRDGDRLVRYAVTASDGYLLVRGDRLVWPCEFRHRCITDVSLRSLAEREEFKLRGGAKAFLNGEFDWPDATWVNPAPERLWRNFKGEIIER